ncbi:MAG: DUF1801 domain-containing protein [Chloroflexi bacterium]|nr:DUF1801 domain-containing protein [Chloroflexota bacterium]
MAKSSATTVEQYLNELPPDRRAVISALREVILSHLPDGYREGMNWGMITYEIPLDRYPDTYNGQPLGYVAVAAQKNYFSLYLMGVYQDSKQETWLKQGFEQAGKKLDMGKSCVRFRKLDDLPLDVVGQVIASTSPADLIAVYEQARRHH